VRAQSLNLGSRAGARGERLCGTDFSWTLQDKSVGENDRKAHPEEMTGRVLTARESAALLDRLA